MTKDTISINDISVNKIREMANRNGYVIILVEDRNRSYFEKIIYQLDLTLGSRKPSKFIEHFYGYKLFCNYIISKFKKIKVNELIGLYILHKPEIYFNDEGNMFLKLGK